MSCKCKALTLVLIAIFLTFILTISYNVIVNGTPTWSIQTIDKNADGDGFIVLDSNDNPHIVYNDYFFNNSTFGTYNLMYATLNNSSWNTEIVSKQYHAIGFALDSQNNPHIIASTNRNNFPGTLTYISWTGSSWSIQTVDDQSNFEGTASLAIDSEGNPHIAYLTNGPMYQLPDPAHPLWAVYIYAKYASWTGSSWNIETLNPTNETGNFWFLTGVNPTTISLALDSSNNAHILYCHRLNLVYTVSTSSGWNNQTIFDSMYGNMILDSSGYPNIIYLSNPPYQTDGALMYSSWNGSAWNNQTVISNGSIENVKFGYLAIDSNNFTHIDFVNNSTLYYSSWNGNTWSTEAVDSNVHAAGPIIFDSSDNPHTCYMGIPPNHAYLMYATANKPTQLPSKPLPFAFIGIAVMTVVTIVSLSLVLYKRQRKNSNKNL